MNINIPLRIDPTKWGKSGELALCVYCAKATEWRVCCDRQDGLLPLDSRNLYDLAETYSLTTDQIDELEQAVTNFEERV
jgi:hypothetical protein